MPGGFTAFLEWTVLGPVLFSLISAGTTLLGGVTAAHLTRGKELVMALAAGLMLGVVFFDLIPEALELTGGAWHGVPEAMPAVAAGFFTFHLLERLLGAHPGHERGYAVHSHSVRRLGLLAGGGLVFHSLLDGFGIGTAFQVSGGLGLSVAVAVIAHDFADGFNAFTLPSAYGNERKRAFHVLYADAAAPVVGAGLAIFLTVPPETAGLYLGYFAGVLLYLATAEVLPQAHSRRRGLALLATGTAMGAMWLIVGFAEHSN
ncbi:ZIP family metal transporter [Haloglycomyces albus]|uniref:ZIP family metal transporter n=1 Tax=Haloglycomyces albus TaxID=526067 RepID=UPI00046D2C85|nr:ZIP family metal transporter [Haloglycomyces albus]